MLDRTANQPTHSGEDGVATDLGGIADCTCVAGSRLCGRSVTSLANDTPAELDEGHTWAALDMEAKHTPSVVRASPHYFNTLAEIDLLADVIDRGRFPS